MLIEPRKRQLAALSQSPRARQVSAANSPMCVCCSRRRRRFKGLFVRAKIGAKSCGPLAARAHGGRFKLGGGSGGRDNKSSHKGAAVGTLAARPDLFLPFAAAAGSVLSPNPTTARHQPAGQVGATTTSATRFIRWASKTLSSVVIINAVAVQSKSTPLVWTLKKTANQPANKTIALARTLA